MAKKSPSIVSITAWVIGILVSLAVGFGLINKTLYIGMNAVSPVIPYVVTQIAGWVVVVGAVLSVIMAIFGK